MLKNIVSLSGGKDSTAMLLMMLEKKETIHSIVFFDTGWEFPEMLEHINKLEKFINMEITHLHPIPDFNYYFFEKKYGWPSFSQRWCTGKKISTIQEYYNLQDNFISCIGYAADETKRISIRTKKYPERYPLIEYDVSEKEALRYCYSKGFDWNGLYEVFNRVSCFCCPMKRINNYRIMRKKYPELWEKMLAMDKKQEKSFWNTKSVHQLDQRFFMEEQQQDLFQYRDMTNREENHEN